MYMERARRKKARKFGQAVEAFDDYKKYTERLLYAGRISEEERDEMLRAKAEELDL